MLPSPCVYRRGVLPKSKAIPRSKERFAQNEQGGVLPKQRYPRSKERFAQNEQWGVLPKQRYPRSKERDALNEKWACGPDSSLSTLWNPC